MKMKLKNFNKFNKDFRGFVEKLKQYLKKNNLEFYENFDTATVSSMRLGVILKLVIFPHDESELERLMIYLFSVKLNYRVFGNLSNVLIFEKLTYPVIVTSKMTEEIEFNGSTVNVSAGTLLPKFCEQVRKRGLSGVEGLIGIPATVGGAIKNNAGAYGFSISDRLVSLKVFFQGKVFNLSKNEIKFDYHYSNLDRFIILQATFLFENKPEYDIINLSNKFTYLRGKTQPMGLSLGSVFKKVNGKSAGFYIERSGLKGFREGGIVVSNKHANFFVNDKNGSVSDFLHLLAIVQSRVEKQFGVWLVPEIEKIGEINETFSRPSYTL